jgi:hypothetical protein
MIDTPVTTTTQEPTERVLIAVQLGWLAVESFGLLSATPATGNRPHPRRWMPAGSSISPPGRRTSEQLISLQALNHGHPAGPRPASPVPADPLDLLSAVKADRQDLDRRWAEFENWSWEVWNTLQIQSPLVGQAYTCGGDLADTYWYPQGAGAGKLAETLRSHRLRYVAECLDDLADHLPYRAARLIHHSLDRWSIGESLEKMDEAGQKRALERLEAQAKVWRDLLFGLRQAGSYLLARDRRRVAWGALVVTALLVIWVGLAAWLAVLLLSMAGRALLASSPGYRSGGRIGDDLVGSGAQLAELVGFTGDAFIRVYCGGWLHHPYPAG